MRFLTAIIAVVLCSQTFAQTIKKGKGQLNGLSYNYYYLKPAKDIRGIVILMGGTGEKPQSVFKRTSLSQLLADMGFVTIVPEVHNLLYADQYSIDVLNNIVNTQSKIFDTRNIVLGGFSSGGAIAVRYSEYILSNTSAINLKGLFVIDPPLDLERIYAAAERMVNNCGGLIKQQGVAIKAQLEGAFGGPPKDRVQQYRNNSSFAAGAADGGNAGVLKNLPVRLYCEPDLAFVRKTYCAGLIFEDLNAFDLEGLNAFLLKAGNTNCEYITTKGKGFHSWNIIDPINCAEWIAAITK